MSIAAQPEPEPEPEPASAAPPTGLVQRVVRGSGWTLAGTVCSQLLRFGSNLVLTRLLFPEAFGLMSIAQSIVTAAHLLSDVGLTQSIVRSERGHEARYQDTIWTLNIAKSLLIGLLMIVCAPIAAHVYAQPALLTIVPAMALPTIIGAFASTKVALINRRLEIHRLTLLELASQACGIATMITWASRDASPWALVAGNWASTLATVAFSHLLIAGRGNRLLLDRAIVGEVLSFGGWVLVSSGVTFLLGEGSNLLTASLVGTRSVAYIGLSTTLALVAWNAIQQISGRVLFPAYAEVWRRRADDFPRVVARSRRVQLVGACAVAAALALAGDRVVATLYDPRYRPVGALLQIQAVGTVFAFISSSYANVLWAMGRAGLNTVILAAQALLQIGLLIIGYSLGGVLGLMTATSFIGLALYPINAIIFARLGLFQPRLDAPVFVLGTALAAWVWLFGAWHFVAFN